MRVLVISNLYPPHYIGGYELGCRDVVEALRRRGHAVTVLTSTYGVGRPARDSYIIRCLETELSWDSQAPTARYWRRMLRRELWNRAMFKNLVSARDFDVVYVWNVRAISLALVLMARQIGMPLCYYISDDWLEHVDTLDRWLNQPTSAPRALVKQGGERWLALAGLGLSGRALDLRHVQFASRYLERAALQAGRAVADGRVIYWGVDGAEFAYRAEQRPQVRRLLYVGQVVPRKGAHTAIEAVRLLHERHGCGEVELTIAGGTLLPEYEAQLRQQVEAAGLGTRVRFAGQVPRNSLPQLYHDHDALVFPSIWEEPFSITLLEAMSSGLPVAGTDTGGSAEILEHERNALVFPKEDAPACARQLLRLIEDPSLAERLRACARQTTERHYRIEHTVDQIEQHLSQVCEST